MITVSPGKPQRSTNPPFLSLRIRDQGGGVSRQNLRQIFSYAFTTAEAMLPEVGSTEGSLRTTQCVGGSTEITRKDLQTGFGTFYGLGYGLPMSNLYARCVENVRN